MSKPRFFIGEFVCAVNHESSTLFYIYDYRAGNNHPYRIVSIKRQRRYTAKARDLRAISNIINLITTFLQNSNSTIKIIRNSRSNDRYIPDPYPLSWTLDLRNKETRYADV